MWRIHELANYTALLQGKHHDTEEKEINIEGNVPPSCTRGTEEAKSHQEEKCWCGPFGQIVLLQHLQEEDLWSKPLETKTIQVFALHYLFYFSNLSNPLIYFIYSLDWTDINLCRDTLDQIYKDKTCTTVIDMFGYSN